MATCTKKERKYREIIPFTKIDSEKITDLNVKYEPIKHLEGSIGGNLHDNRYADNILDTTTVSSSTGELLK